MQVYDDMKSQHATHNPDIVILVETIFSGKLMSDMPIHAEACKTQVHNCCLRCLTRQMVTLLNLMHSKSSSVPHFFCTFIFEMPMMTHGSPSSMIHLYVSA